MLEQFSNRIGGSIPFACQDWANTKAAYRLLSSDRVTERAILAGHYEATRDRSLGDDAPLLILHDTTTFTYNRTDVAAVGITHRSFTRKDRDGRPQHSVVCGLQMHSSMVVTPEGLPLGLASIHFWTQDRVQRMHGNEEKDQPNTGSDRRNGEPAMARWSAAIVGADRHAGTLRPYRRSRERHL